MNYKVLFEKFKSSGDVADYLIEHNSELSDTEKLDIMEMSNSYLKENKITGIEITEDIVRRVDSEGKTTNVLDRETRKRHATQTTGLSSARRKLIARKAARTKRRDISAQRRAQKKRKRAIIKRQAMGL